MLAVAVAALIAVTPQDPPQAPPPPSPAQSAPLDTTRREALRVFLDCGFCDDDFLRTEITFVDYVRDRAVAQVHVLVTREHTGSGGWAYTFAFLGRRQFEGRGDTLRTSVSGTATSDERRRAIAQVLRLGLVRYVAATPLADHIEIRFTGGDSTRRAAPRDPWNYWVFRLSLNGNFGGEKRYTRRNVNSGIDVSRVTPVSRVEFELDASNSFNKSQYDEPDTTTADTSDTILRAYINRRERYSGEAVYVRAIAARWSAAVGADARQDSYTNIDLRWRLRGGIEYSAFPYSESTRRQLQFRYIIGPEVSRYTDTTVYLRIRESRVVQSLEAEFELTQPWGNASIESSFSQYLHDLSKYGLDTWGNVSVRLVRGLSLELWGGYSVIHNQLYLRKEGSSLPDIIAQRRQLETSYSYYMGVGVSYRFGSIFNNVVNPRFGF